MLTDFENSLIDELCPCITNLGYELVTLSVVGPKNSPILRVYVDCNGGISFDELAEVQGAINPVIEKLDPFLGSYTLEVSSPGIDRPLRTLEHFNRFVGEKAYVRVQFPINDRRNFKGIIKGIEGDLIEIESEEGIIEIDFNNILRANIIADI